MKVSHDLAFEYPQHRVPEAESTTLGTNHVCALRDLVSFAQFKKREKYPWSSVTFSKVADF